MLISQLRQELTVKARNGEQLLLLIAIPVAMLVFFTQVDILPTNDLTPVEFLVPGILAMAIMSSAMVSMGIATGFERSYGVLKRLGTTPLGTHRLVLAKVLAVAIVEIVQLALLVAVGIGLGWHPRNSNWPALIVGVILGTACFVGIGLSLAGRLRAEINLAAQNGLYLVLLLLGGIIVPNQELPHRLSGVTRLLPSAALSQILRDGFSSTETAISSWLILSLWAVGSCAVATIGFRWTD